MDYLCENETRLASLKVRGEVFISGNLQALEMSREIVVCRGSPHSTRKDPFLWFCIP